MRQEPIGPTPFGRASRALFSFAPEWTPLNHGSYGTIPTAIAAERDRYLRASEACPDKFKLSTYPKLLAASRAAVAPLIGAHADEIVFVPNATSGINTIFRNLRFERGDVVLHFTSVYGACLKTLQNLGETVGVEPVEIPVLYPIEHAELVSRFRAAAADLRRAGRTVKAAIYDTVTSGPGVRVPWEDLTAACRELGIYSVIDAAHGIGHLDLAHLGADVRPDFVVTNCHKWLFCPRGCAVLYVPFRNQHLVKTTYPTSHGYEPPWNRPADSSRGGPASGSGNDSDDDKNAVTAYFQTLFVDVATLDNTMFCVVPRAIRMRQEVWGGEAAIRAYCHGLARDAGARVAALLGTELLRDREGRVLECCLSNVRLPLRFSDDAPGAIPAADGPAVRQWLVDRYFGEYDTYIQTMWDAPRAQMWVRLSAQVYLALEDFEWGAKVLLELCERLDKEWRKN